jgi:hypothetical protein
MQFELEFSFKNVISQQLHFPMILGFKKLIPKLRLSIYVTIWTLLDFMVMTSRKVHKIQRRGILVRIQ